jgi:hypothetical protein
MNNDVTSGNDLACDLGVIQEYLKTIQLDLSEIRRLIQDELQALREREFWRDYGHTYNQE